MSTRKNTTAARILAALALCLAALAVCLRIPVYASRSNQGTLTDKNEWMSLEAQTTRNLITITRGSLTEQGWNNIGDQIHSEGLDYNDPGVDLKTPEYGYGIQAQNSSDDIGNKSTKTAYGTGSPCRRPTASKPTRGI